MSRPEPAIEVPAPASVLAVAVAIGGHLLALALVLAWLDRLPGGHRLRTAFEPLGVRDRRAVIAHAAERLALFQRENAELVDGAILFVGSSTIERFPLAESFPSKRCANRGVANQSARDLLDQLDGILPAVRPGGVVLYTGSIDFERGASERDVAERVSAVLDRVRAKYGDAPAALIAILPRREMTPDDRERWRATNRSLAEVARSRGAAFVDVARAPITSEDGFLARECSTDERHLGELGYRALARWIVQDGGEAGRRLAP